MICVILDIAFFYIRRGGGTVGVPVRIGGWCMWMTAAAATTADFCGMNDTFGIIHFESQLLRRRSNTIPCLTIIQMIALD